MYPTRPLCHYCVAGRLCTQPGVNTSLDTNILVYARRRELPQHKRARDLLQELAEGDEPWALPWPCVYE